MNLEAAIADLGGFLALKRIPFAVVGALALHHYGRSRATNDVDVLLGAEHQTDVVELLEGKGYVTLHRSEGYSNHLHPDPALGRIDLIYVDPGTLEKITSNAQTATIGRLHVLVPKPEHLAAMKIHAIRNDPSRAHQDMADIQFLMKLPGVDRTEIRRYFQEAGQAERLDELENE